MQLFSKLVQHRSIILQSGSRDQSLMGTLLSHELGSHTDLKSYYRSQLLRNLERVIEINTLSLDFLRLTKGH